MFEGMSRKELSDINQLGLDKPSFLPRTTSMCCERCVYGNGAHRRGCPVAPMERGSVNGLRRLRKVGGK